MEALEKIRLRAAREEFNVFVLDEDPMYDVNQKKKTRDEQDLENEEI